MRSLSPAVLLGMVWACPLPGQSFGAADAAVRSGITQGIYPGAVLVVGRRDTVLYAQGYGHLTWRESSPAASPDSTLWDLASLSKVVGTTGAIMLLVERGQVALDTPVVRYLPRFTGGRKPEVTVRMLLNHTSGLRSYVEFFRLAPSRDSAISLLYGEPLHRVPGTFAEYSDLNALLLGLLIERVTGESLDAFVTREVFAPLGMLQTRYRPGRQLLHRIAPTGQWRGRPSAGEVNDQNAVRFGGAAGHAGVFSTGTDLSRFARMWLGEGMLDSRRLVPAELVRTFLSHSPGSGTRLLGWDTPDPHPRGQSPYGTLLGPTAYGHTGWTGTLLWIDPDKNLFLVFLTNRSYAPRVGHSISRLRQLRSTLADAVVRAAASR
jgi:CubicO group peptidase (beta-lactamase class C family)